MHTEMDISRSREENSALRTLFKISSELYGLNSVSFRKTYPVGFETHPQSFSSLSQQLVCLWAESTFHINS